MKKILIFEGSPREASNTRQLLNVVTRRMMEEGSEVHVIQLSKLKAKASGCIACGGCKRNNDLKCVVRDDLAESVEIIPHYDVVIFASPIYFFGVTAQTKAALDRMYCLLRSDYSTPLVDKKFAVFCTGGGSLEDSGFRSIESAFASFTDFFDVARPLTHFVHCENNDMPDIDAVEPELLAFADAILNA